MAQMSSYKCNPGFSLSSSFPWGGGRFATLSGDGVLRRVLASAAERGPPPAGPAEHCDGDDDDDDSLGGRGLKWLCGRDPGADVCRRLFRGVDGRQLALQVRDSNALQ